jgi:hypothetical protein
MSVLALRSRLLVQSHKLLNQGLLPLLVLLAQLLQAL